MKQSPLIDALLSAVTAVFPFSEINVFTCESLMLKKEQILQTFTGC